MPRILENLEAYVFRHGPAGVVGSDGPALAAVGVGLEVLDVHRRGGLGRGGPARDQREQQREQQPRGGGAHAPVSVSRSIVP